jgi:hypothetical protein
MTDALDRYLARSDADERVKAYRVHRNACVRWFQNRRMAVPDGGLLVNSDKADTAIRALAEELERARWMLERGDD